MPIGDISEIFRTIRYQKVKALLKATDETPMSLIQDAYLEIEMRSVLDNLGIEFDCCRMHLTTANDMRDVY
jgi:DNA-directed RNA polymerase subunit N (RpoN/RPB10)